MLAWVMLLLVFAVGRVVYGQPSSDPDQLLDYCLDSKFHKTKPGPERDLFSECKPWAERGCCTGNTTQSIHEMKMYNFNYDHCPDTNMSKACRRHFVRDHCFFECSPNVGPWMVEVDMKTRKERFYKAPLCASFCHNWFQACKNDITCTDNWMRNFNWKNKRNECPLGSTCRTFGQVFGTAENFCQTVWDGSWEYTADDKPCMKPWFQSHGENPNDKVAQLRVDEMKAGNKKTGAGASGGVGRDVMSTGILTVCMLQLVVVWTGM